MSWHNIRVRYTQQAVLILPGTQWRESLRQLQGRSEDNVELANR